MKNIITTFFLLLTPTDWNSNGEQEKILAAVNFKNATIRVGWTFLSSLIHLSKSRQVRFKFVTLCTTKITLNSVRLDLFLSK